MNRRKFFAAMAMVPAGTLGHMAFATERPALYVLDADDDMPGGGHPLSSHDGWEFTLDGVKVEEHVARLDERAGFIDVYVPHTVPGGFYRRIRPRGSQPLAGHATEGGPTEILVIERRYGVVRISKFPDPRPITA